ncbi:MAG: hypothetical protein EBY11_12560 [Proteobacteria bacterium]|nr:hypothetical protein [Pseudomonadota bacterium]
MELGLGQDAAAGTMVVAVMTDGVRDGQSGQVRDFARGLRLVLVAGDVNAFRGYLGQWDDWLTARFPMVMPRRHIKSTSWTGNLLP